MIWAPVVWYPDTLYLLRPREGEARKKRIYAEGELDNAWRIGTDEEVVVRGKLRPAVIISSEREHRERGCAHVLPLLRPTQWHLDHEAEIRRHDGIPGFAWLDNIPIQRNAPESRVVDCSKGVRPPMVLVERRNRIALMDMQTVKELRDLWSDYLLFANA